MYLLFNGVEVGDTVYMPEDLTFFNQTISIFFIKQCDLFSKIIINMYHGVDLYCVLQSIPFLVLISYMQFVPQMLFCSCLAGNLCSISLLMSWSNALFIGGIFSVWKQLLMAIHNDWMWVFHKLCNFWNFLIFCSEKDFLVYKCSIQCIRIFNTRLFIYFWY